MRLEMVTPTDYVGNLMELANGRRGGRGGGFCRYQPKLDRTQCKRARRKAWPMLDNGVARDNSPGGREEGHATLVCLF